MVRRKVTDALGSLHGLIWSNIAASPSKKAFPEGSDERLNGDLSHSDGKDSSVVRDVQTASQRVGHVQRLDQVEVTTATAFTGAHAPGFLVTRSSDAMGHRQKRYETAAFQVFTQTASRRCTMTPAKSALPPPRQNAAFYHYRFEHLPSTRSGKECKHLPQGQLAAVVLMSHGQVSIKHDQVNMKLGFSFQAPSTKFRKLSDPSCTSILVVRGVGLTQI